jgi:TonB family protein
MVRVMVAAAAVLCVSGMRAQEVAPAPSSSGNTTARLLNIDECKPWYPSLSRVAGETGAVRVRVHIAGDGRFVGVSLIGSSGFSRLDEATVRAISTCKFAAATRAGVPVDSSFVVEYKWRLEEQIFGPPLDCNQAYPEASLQAREHGQTSLRFRLDVAGKAEKIEIARSSGSAGLDQASISALRRCRFDLTAKQAAIAAAQDITVLFLWLLPDSQLPTQKIGPFITDP